MCFVIKMKHLFLNCSLAQQVWRCICSSKVSVEDWFSVKDVIKYAVSLQSSKKIAFLLIVSVICWTLWKHRNKICFQNKHVKTTKSIIYLIISLILYWTGSKKTKKKVQEETEKWILDAEIID